MFSTFLDLGFDHISDIKAYDHILFIVALCGVYQLKQWRNVVILVTAFTIGHSLTLALAALDIVHVPSDLIEFLIPVTIFLTALFNLIRKGKKPARMKLNYAIALFFGLIHGMGFSNYFRALMGRESEIVMPLFAFNIGVELGQLCIVLAILLLGFLCTGILKLKQKYWVFAISILAALVSLKLMWETRLWV